MAKAQVPEHTALPPAAPPKTRRQKPAPRPQSPDDMKRKQAKQNDRDQATARRAVTNAGLAVTTTRRKRGPVAKAPPPVPKKPYLMSGAPTANPAVTRIGAAGKEGMPKLMIDHQALALAASTHMPFNKLAIIFGVSSITLSRDPIFRSIIDKARAEKQQELLSAQFVSAINDRNPTMLIWLGKQYLGQKDVTRVETTGANGGPIQNKTLQVTAVIPPNGRDTAPPEQISVQGPDEVMDNELDSHGRPDGGIIGDEVVWEPFVSDEDDDIANIDHVDDAEEAWT